MTVVAGTGTAGPPVNEIPATSAALNAPGEVALDSSARIRADVPARSEPDASIVEILSGSPEAAATRLAFWRSENAGVVEAKVSEPMPAEVEPRRQARTASTLMVIESSSQLQKERSPFPKPRNEGIAHA